MIVTRAQIDAILDVRLREFSAITDITNEDYVDAIGWGVRVIGKSTATIDDVTDTDLAALEGLEIDACIGLAELRLIETRFQNYVQVTRTLQSVEEDFSDLQRILRSRATNLRKDLQAQYGHLLAIPLTEDGADRLFGELEQEKAVEINIVNVGAYE